MVPVDDVNVLVIFYSRGGETERNGVMLAEGAVQAGAKIRLRRARDVAEEAVIAADPAWKAARDRMEDEFAAPRVVDAEWADVIAFGTPAGLGRLSPELAVYLEVLERAGTLAGKIGTAFTSSYTVRMGSEGAVSGLQAALLGAGMLVMPKPEGADDFERAHWHGRAVVELARALKLGREALTRQTA